MGGGRAWIKHESSGLLEPALWRGGREGWQSLDKARKQPPKLGLLGGLCLSAREEFSLRRPVYKTGALTLSY